MFSMNEIFDIVTKWCGKEFGSNKITATTTGDDGVMEAFTITCFVDDTAEPYVDIGAFSDPNSTKISIWSRDQDNVNIELNDTIKWNEEGGFHEFCGEAEMRRLYEAIQCSSIHDDSKPDDVDNDRSNKGIPYLSDINTMEDIRASVLELVPRFNTASDILVLGMPYIVRNIETGTTIIATMTSKSTDELTFNSWKGCFTIDAKTYHKGDTWEIYSANINDSPVFQAKPQIINQNFDEAVQDPINEENCPPTGTIVCHRIIDYKNQKFDKCLTTGIENFYKVDTESGVTVIKQFLYKVDEVENSEEDYVEYSIMIPVSESDKKYYMDNGWKIHPMFYNKYKDCYMNSVVLSENHVMDFAHREEDSITIQILSGLQLLYLIEFGLNQNPNLGSSMYAGIKYEDGYVVISNAYADVNNRLVIDDEIQPISVYSDYGYISRFMYWNEKYDWLFLPKETTNNPILTDSFFIGPTRNLKSIILWGDDDSNAGIFRLDMDNSSTRGYGYEYIVPWEFGE